jgi:probable FeS assembly SUF system protein SufT
MSMRKHENTPIVVNRDVKAVIIPAGIEVKLRTGSVGYVTQALGGSFTVYVEGNLFRVAGVDADAIGMEVVPPPELKPDATDDDFEEVVWGQIRTVFDPEIPVNIAELGLIYTCDITKDEAGQRSIKIDMTLTAPGCGMGEVLVADVKDKLSTIPTVKDVDVELVFDPPWSADRMTEAARLQTGMM